MNFLIGLFIRSNFGKYHDTS